MGKAARAGSTVGLGTSQAAAPLTALVTAASRLRTSSAICASTRLGALPRSPLLRTRSLAFITNNNITALNPEVSGHPDDKWGWAVSVGFKVNVPMIGQGDYFQTQVNYTQGALKYIFQNPNGNPYIQDGDSVAYGVISDAVYGGTLGAGNATNLELTTAWNVNASYEHFWSPRWRTSIHGGYAEVKYGDQANAILCVTQFDGGGAGSLAVANAGCDNNFNWWWVGTRTQWNVTKDFYMGLDVAYTKISSAKSSDGLFFGPFPAGTNTGTRFIDDQDNWQFRFRVHRDFYP